MKKKLLLGLFSAIVLFALFLYGDHRIGLSASEIEGDIRFSQKIQDDWAVNGVTSSAMAAYISYPEDMSDHTFSIYVNRPGFSFGYFFRGGGDISEVEKFIAEFTVEGYNERAFISMNEQKVDKIQIYDGDVQQEIDIDEDKPFAMVFPINAGTLTFVDINGNAVDYLRHPL